MYTLTLEKLAYVQKDARILHPLPKIEEINLPIEIEPSDQRIAYFRQVENGLYIRMALIASLLE